VDAHRGRRRGRWRGVEGLARDAYRYRDEGLRVLAAQAPDPHEALQKMAE
jgi:hypothetical protein